MGGISNITIEQQLAEIGINETHAKMRIEQHRLKMRIKTEQPEMQIDRKSPTFRINRKRIRSESGLKSTPELSMEYRNKGRVGALRGTRTAVQDGNFLGELRSPGDRVGRLARNKTMRAILKKSDINIGLMPKSLPEVEWDKGYMHINWSKHSIVIDWDGEYLPKVTLDPTHSIEVYLRKEPYFRIRVNDAEPVGIQGRLVDKEI